MRRTCWIFALIMTFGLAACSKGGSGSDGNSSMQPLTSDQKQEVSAVSDSMSMATSVPESAQQSSVQTMDKNERAQNMTKALKDGCQFDVNLPKQGEQPQNGDFHMKVDGSACPITLMTQMTYKTTRSPQSMDMSMGMDQSYQVRSPDYAALNDVTMIHMSGAFNVHASADGASGGGTFKGEAVSIQYGHVQLAMDLKIQATSQSASSVAVQTIIFPDFTAQGKVAVTQTPNSDPQASYYVNGVSVTAKEFQEVFGSAMSGDGPGMMSQALRIAQ